MSKTIGIDLGTTNSLCAYFGEEAPILIPNVHGSFLTPSVVGILESGEIVIGAAAKELRVTQPSRVAWCFKRFMGSDRKIPIADKSFSAHELSSLVLKSLIQDAERYFSEKITDAVITVPAYFNDHQRQATKLAGEMAGLNVRRIVNEPTAAALVYGFHQRDTTKNLCVIDLGGGTFDVTVMEVFEGTLEIRATAGESMLGGEDFTDRIVAAMLAQNKIQLEQAELRQPLVVARLRSECEQAKRALMNQETVRIRMPDESGQFPDNATEYKLNNQSFAKLCKQLMERLTRPIDRALRDAHCSPPDIDDVILVGGATRMQIVKEHIEAYFTKKPLMSYNPDEVVALGAAIQAALIDQDQAVQEMVMTDVCPFTLGIEVAKEIGGDMEAGYFQPILHRNSTIPISREETFRTIAPNQKYVEVRVFQGDARRVKDNLELGMLKIDKLPPGPAGLPIHIRFTYDLNGILEVEAYTQGGRKNRVVLTNFVRGLSPAQIAEAVERIQSLKFYPRDDLRHLRLAQFCERMLGEVSPGDRRELDRVLDIFETAMKSSDRAEFESARATLLMVLDSLGITYSENEHDDNLAE